jgi:MerR-like DNA binding protein
MQGFYTAKEAQKRLGLTQDKFQYMVRKGLVKKVILPGRTYGVYPQADVNRLAAAINATIEQYVADAPVFEVATPTDLNEIHALCARTMPRVTPVETNRKWMERNPEAFYTLRDNGILVAYACLFPVEEGWLMRVLKDEVRIGDVPVEYIYPFTSDGPVDVYLRDLIVGKAENHQKAKQYGMRMLLELTNVITELGARGVNIRAFYAYATSQDGNRLCQGLHFQTMPEMGPFAPGKMVYKLDVATADSPLINHYKARLAEWQHERQLAYELVGTG